MIRDIFKKYEDEFLRFEDVKERPYGNRPDLHAFMLLDKLVPGKRDMVSAAEHDEIWLDVDTTDLEGIATEDQIVELIRCGVRYDEDTDSLALFV